MRPLFFYRSVTKEILDHCGCDPKDYSYSYKVETSEGVSYNPLFIDTATQRLKDKNGQWTIEKNGLCISRDVILSNPACLKGSGQDALVCSGGEYSLCIIWTCNSMKTMGYIDSVKDTNGGCEVFRFHKEFMPGDIGEDIALETVFYVKKASSQILQGEESCCNETGINLGRIDYETFALSSENYMFPCKDENDPKKPLWWLTMDIWEDATMEPFSPENVCLHFNRHYTECPVDTGTGKIRHQDVLVEIFTTAYLMLIHEMIENGYRDLIFNTDPDELEPGSICSVLRNFITHSTTQIQTGTLNSMEMSIHEMVRESLLTAMKTGAENAVSENE